MVELFTKNFRMCDVAVVSGVPGRAGVRVTGSELLGGSAGLVAELPWQGFVGGGVSAGVAEHPGAAAAAGRAGGQRGGGPAVAGGGGRAARAVTPTHPTPAGRNSAGQDTILQSLQPVQSESGAELEIAANLLRQESPVQLG